MPWWRFLTGSSSCASQVLTNFPGCEAQLAPTVLGKFSAWAIELRVSESESPRGQHSASFIYHFRSRVGCSHPRAGWHPTSTKHLSSPLFL